MNPEQLVSPFRYESDKHVPEELAIDIAHLALLEVDAIPDYLHRLGNREEHPETYKRYMGAIIDEALIFDALWTEQNIDSMTGLYNKSSWERQLESRVEESIAEGKGDLAIFMVDLDNFKLLNDTLGHAIGDEAIRRVGAYLQANLRTASGSPKKDMAGHQGKATNRLKGTTNQMASHWGGDEFAVTASFQPAGKDSDARGRRKGRLSSPERAEAIATRLTKGIVGVADTLHKELLADPQYARKAASMDTLFGATIGWAIHDRGSKAIDNAAIQLPEVKTFFNIADARLSLVKMILEMINARPPQDAKAFFEAADGDLERRKKEKKAVFDESIDAKTAAEIAAAEALLRKHGRMR